MIACPVISTGAAVARRCHSYSEDVGSTRIRAWAGRGSTARRSGSWIDRMSMNVRDLETPREYKRELNMEGSDSRGMKLFA